MDKLKVVNLENMEETQQYILSLESRLEQSVRELERVSKAAVDDSMRLKARLARCERAGLKAIDKIRQSTAGIGADLITIERTSRSDATERVRKHVQRIDSEVNGLGTALSGKGDKETRCLGDDAMLHAERLSRGVPDNSGKVEKE